MHQQITPNKKSLYTPIRDYAIIGNLRSAVLASKDASIDWAPAPFIHSPSVFAKILDAKKGGTGLSLHSMSTL